MGKHLDYNKIRDIIGKRGDGYVDVFKDKRANGFRIKFYMVADVSKIEQRLPAIAEIAIGMFPGMYVDVGLIRSIFNTHSLTINVLDIL